MILSASRRTDIPAWYGAWFLNRLREGLALVPNPYAENLHMLRKIPLSPDVVDCIVFWSKNPRPFLDFLPEIQQLGYPFYFQFTLNPYEAAIEQNLPALDERIDTFHRLSAIIGPERIVWRYDPVIIDEAHPLNWHGEQFERLCALLHADTCRCVFSFFDRYAKDQSGFREVEEATMRAVARSFSSTAARYDLPLSTCSEAVDLTPYRITHAACIDSEQIRRILGRPVHAKKDPNQRPFCGCMESMDIGSYHSCINGCIYCYANQGIERARRRMQRHEPHSPMLLGHPDGTEKIVEVRAESLLIAQTSLFD